MAFYNKVVPMLRKSISASNSLNVHSSMFNAMRCMSTKLFVGGFISCIYFPAIDTKAAFLVISDTYALSSSTGLSFGTDDSSLKRAFDSFGDIDSGI